MSLSLTAIAVQNLTNIHTLTIKLLIIFRK